ncbi:L-arabinose transport system permease protein AraQ [Microbacterium hydrocarbonoxydans]|uniref:L-arabinose transport system permease protein AraQ n=1 Tax=Microbacterium hydrocarbonoxydans TaxID=273678 RepID=A0A0M2HPS5_9MICO|nr:carbohydrate ABC transporter permease [Microbacterium hydrocarbonoxydans]KJL48742.1 L-arabinose transport system permease protein AraQ [Microbacterium hydrocarbonoxydans]
MSTSALNGRPNIAAGILGWLWLAIVLLPIYFIVVTSLRPREDFYQERPLSLPSRPTLDAYATVIGNDFGRYIGNSLVVTISTVAVTLLVALGAAFTVVRNRSRWSSRVFRLFLLGIAIPIQATIIPVYYLIVQLGLYDTLWALILPSVAFAIPLSVLILSTFLRDIPGELFESMTVDGAGELRILWSLVIPMTKPALVTVGVYNALSVWNGFLFPLVLTQSAETRVLPLSLWSYQGEFTMNVPAVLAAVVLSALPILAAYIVGRRQLVSGLTAGFGK